MPGPWSPRGIRSMRHLLANSRHSQNCQEPADAAAERVADGDDERVFANHHEQSRSEDGAIDRDQRQEHAELLIQERGIPVDRHLHELHEGRDDDDEQDESEKLQMQRHQDVMVRHPVQQCRGRDDENDGQPQADGALDLAGNADERAQPEEVGQQNVLGEDGRDEHDERFADFGAEVHFAFSSRYFLEPAEEPHDDGQHEERPRRRHHDDPLIPARSGKERHRHSEECPEANDLARHGDDQQDERIAQRVEEPVQKGPAGRLADAVGFAAAHHDAIREDQPHVRAEIRPHRGPECAQHHIHDDDIEPDDQRFHHHADVPRRNRPED